MNRKRIWGWWFFDWACQPYHTLLVTFIFSIYYAEVAKRSFIAEGMDAAQAGAAAQSLWGYGLAIGGVMVVAVVVLSVLVFRHTPDSMGQHPDGAERPHPHPGRLPRARRPAAR